MIKTLHYIISLLLVLFVFCAFLIFILLCQVNFPISVLVKCTTIAYIADYIRQRTLVQHSIVDRFQL